MVDVYIKITFCKQKVDEENTHNISTYEKKKYASHFNNTTLEYFCILHFLSTHLSIIILEINFETP